MTRDQALEAFKAMRADVEQFDDHPPIDPERHDSDMFSQRVPLYMKSYLVNWLRTFMRDYGDVVEKALESSATPKD